MGSFKSNSRSREFSGGRSSPRSEGFNRGFRGERSEGRSGGRPGGRSGFRSRDSGSFERRSEMHKVTCDKCGKQCEVPFRPTGNKPVFCSDCFRKDGGSSSNFSSRDNSSSGISQEQFKEINTKLDKVLKILEAIEFEEDESEDEEESED
ncbi:MAG: CxxC-x17-CxxC domain-containing protein [Candidatus Pacearchaeota archaeon]|jgi:CxxC-x17-CxxC domain-containing protein